MAPIISLARINCDRDTIGQPDTVHDTADEKQVYPKSVGG
jgi:hypothetical protein